MQTIIESTISCSWCGRHQDSVMVTGATDIIEARGHAIEFFRNAENGCDDTGITIDHGRLVTWQYDEPQPDDWKDHYVFRSVDAFPIDTREWWEK